MLWSSKLILVLCVSTTTTVSGILTGPPCDWRHCFQILYTLASNPYFNYPDNEQRLAITCREVNRAWKCISDMASICISDLIRRTAFVERIRQIGNFFIKDVCGATNEDRFHIIQVSQCLREISLRSDLCRTASHEMMEAARVIGLQLSNGGPQITGGHNIEYQRICCARARYRQCVIDVVNSPTLLPQQCQMSIPLPTLQHLVTEFLQQDVAKEQGICFPMSCSDQPESTHPPDIFNTVRPGTNMVFFPNNDSNGASGKQDCQHSFVPRMLVAVLCTSLYKSLLFPE